MGRLYQGSRLAKGGVLTPLYTLSKSQMGLPRVTGVSVQRFPGSRASVSYSTLSRMCVCCF